jgi:hypothetical protein
LLPKQQPKLKIYFNEKQGYTAYQCRKTYHKGLSATTNCQLTLTCVNHVGDITITNNGTLGSQIQTQLTIPAWLQLVKDGCNGFFLKPKNSCVITVNAIDCQNPASTTFTITGTNTNQFTVTVQKTGA